MFSLKRGEDLNEIAIKLIEKINNLEEKINNLEKEQRLFTEFIKRNNHQTFGKFNIHEGEFFIVNLSTGSSIIDWKEDQIIYYSDIDDAYMVVNDYRKLNPKYKYSIAKVVL